MKKSKKKIFKFYRYVYGYRSGRRVQCLICGETFDGARGYTMPERGFKVHFRTIHKRLNQAIGKNNLIIERLNEKK